MSFCLLFCFIYFILFLLTTKYLLVFHVIPFAIFIYFIKVYLFYKYKKMNIDALIEKIKPKFTVNFNLL